MDGSGLMGDAGDAHTLAHLAYSMEVAEMDMPHVVLTRATGYQALTLSGPYSSGMAALAAADFECGNERKFGGGDLSFHVAPLYPPLELLTGGEGPDPSDVKEPGRRGLDRRPGRSSLSHVVCRSSRRAPAASATRAGVSGSPTRRHG